MKTNKLLLAKMQDDLHSEIWFSVVEIYQPLIEKWVSRFGVSENDIADITQDVLFTLVKELPGFVHNGRTGAFRNWLRTIAVNRIRMNWKKNSRLTYVRGEKADQLLRELKDPNSDLSDSWNREHDRHVIAMVLKQIGNEFDSTTVEIFKLLVVDGKDSKTISHQMGVTTAQVYKHKFRVMQRLRSLAQGSPDKGLDSILASVMSSLANEQTSRSKSA